MASVSITLVRFETLPIATATKQIVVEHIMSCRRVTWSPHWFTQGAKPRHKFLGLLAPRATLASRQTRSRDVLTRVERKYRRLGGSDREAR
jgi:hypothetical protein